MKETRQINATILRQLFDTKAIRLEPGAIFGYELAPKEPDFDFERVEGMLLGAAIGDSLGNTSESRLPLARRQIHGEIRDYLISDRADRAMGYPSDDTQLTFWTLEQLIEDNGEFIPEHLARKFANSGRIYGIGRTVKGFLDAFNPAGPGTNAARTPPATARSCASPPCSSRTCATAAQTSGPTLPSRP
jgi:hypothetical protein